MATKRKAKPADEIVTVTASPSPPPPAEFVRRARGPIPGVVASDFGRPVYRYTAGSDDPMPGTSIDVVAFGFGAEATALTSRIYFHDILEFLAPYVVGWVMPGARVVERPVPSGDGLPERSVATVVEETPDPPAVAGVDAFAAIASPDLPAVWTWIRDCLVRSTYERPAEEADAAA